MSKSSISTNAKKVNSFLTSRLHGRPTELYKAASHIMVHGGKRLRPYLVIKSCEILGGTVKQALPAAASIEMIHNFTLVHDDIMDNDDMRHGVPTVHTRFGIPIAILAGDVLFSKAFETISSDSHIPEKQSRALVSSLAKACVNVCEGQLLDIQMAQNQKMPSESQYIKMVEKKTATLFETSCALGALSANSNRKNIANLSSFGKNLGIAFQIVDDLIGVLGDSKITKKPVGNDLRESKKSLPILIAIKSAKSTKREIILNAFGNSEASKNDIKKAVKVMQSLGIEKTIRKKAIYYSARARSSLSSYVGPSKKELISLLNFVVKRSL